MDTAPTFTLTWRIENFSFATHSYQEPFNSPTCIAESLDKTEWFLRLYPRGRNLNCYVPCFLRRAESDGGPETVSVDYKLFLVDADGLQCFTREITNHSFKKLSGFGFPDFMRRDCIFGNKDLYLPGDTMTIKCLIWKQGDISSTSTSCTMCSQIGVENRCFMWQIKDFTTRKWENKLSVSVPSPMKGLPEMSITFSLPDFDEFLNIILSRFDQGESRPQFFRCHISLMDRDGRHRDSKTGEHFLQASDNSWIFPTFINTRKLTANPNLYLPDDTLSLYFEFAISFGSVSNNITKFVHGFSGHEVSTPYPKTDVKERYTLRNDIYRLFTKQKFCDAVLRTKTKNLLVHKAVLCARSSVFSNLFENDDEVKRTSVIDVSDSNTDVVASMLRFMYTDVLNDASFETITELYILGDKYRIFSLKEQCVTMLKAKMTVQNVCNSLVFADLTEDPVINQLAQNFICSNSFEMFQSDEWSRFMVTHSELAGDVMFKFLKKQRL